MQTESLAEALEREHREIDAGIAAFAGGSPAADEGALTRAIHALRRHSYLEEEFLFPLLYQAQAGLAAPLSVMLREHAQLWATLDELERESDISLSLALCRRLTAQLLHHNLKEEKVIYPQAYDLPPEVADRLLAFLGAADVPGGWVCAKARPAPQHLGR
jgi:hemerythrin superfamily protein